MPGYGVLIVNCAYDWLPFWSARYLPVPVAHLVSMGSLNRAMDAAIGAEARRRPGSVAAHSKAQAATFEFGDQLRILGNGLDLSRYIPCYEPLDHLGARPGVRVAASCHSDAQLLHVGHDPHI